jgi:hypothetical protein
MRAVTGSTMKVLNPGPVGIGAGQPTGVAGKRPVMGSETEPPE